MMEHRRLRNSAAWAVGTLWLVLCTCPGAELALPADLEPAATPAAHPPAPVPAPAVDLAVRLKDCARAEFWTSRASAGAVSREAAVGCLESARAYFLRHQLPPGNFQCEYDMNRRQRLADDDQVRQAAALYGLAYLCRVRPTTATQAALIKGLLLWQKNTRQAPDGSFYPTYGEQPEIKSAAVGFVCLALAEFLGGRDKSLTPEGRLLYEATLLQYLNWLERMEIENGAWAGKYILISHERDATANPVADAACLLAYCRASQVLGRPTYRDKAAAAALKRVAVYTGNGWQGECDENELRLFAPLGATALAELAAAGGKEADLAGDAALAIGGWLLYAFEASSRERGMAGFAEAYLAAYAVAAQRKLPLAEPFRAAAAACFTRTLKSQVAHPFAAANVTLQRLKPPPFLSGGVMTAEDSGRLRIDMLQPAVHSAGWMLELFWPDAVNAVVPAAKP